MSKTKKLILASASPRRREILEKTGLIFKVVAGDYEEEMDRGVSPRKLARVLSREKARAVASRCRDAIVIAADTFIIFRGSLFGKPETEREARRMLKILSGRSHSVVTGFTVIDTETGKAVSRSVETKVFIKKLAMKEIDAYVRSGEPLDKAGGYAIQGLGSVIVKRIEGDYYNVVGLPLNALVETLKMFGISVL
ncbi:MAG TPA: nucleoside triphosphate pyrophosphatase [Thermodesulfovibrionales bacterium]|nr:nucleoside triphosphate pyrophosphatase [Thermodesulfovibrionales bacterium]